MNYSFLDESTTPYLVNDLVNTTSAPPIQHDDDSVNIGSVIIVTFMSIGSGVFLFVGLTICCHNACKCGTYSEYIRRLCCIESCLKKKVNNNLVVIELTQVVIAVPVDATETCTICLEVFKKGDKLGSLPCGHKHFHKKCIDQWMKVSGNKSCPICRNVSV
jgi:hypothetical protein